MAVWPPSVAPIAHGLPGSSGPAVTAKYGAALLWVATISIIFQAVYNVEISRYTLYTGEPIFTGKLRIPPSPVFWALFYLLLDWHAVLARSADAIPRRWLERVRGLAHEVDNLLAQYLRGQLLVMLVLAVYYSAALFIARLDVALPVGILTGLLVFIPYVGFGLGLVLATLAALLQFDVGSASAGGLVAVVIANILAFFLVRIVGKNLEA